MEIYVSRSNTLNESDLYRRMTVTWGLYDPVAKSALRLVKETFRQWRELDPAESSAEFRALSAADQFQQMMIVLLDGWDTEIEFGPAAASIQVPEQKALLAELLTQQWRLFGEAFGVTQAREFTIGPKRADAAARVDEEDDTTDSGTVEEFVATPRMRPDAGLTARQ